MNHVSSHSFKQMIKNGVFVFHSSGCFTCEEHIKTMEEQILHYYLIETSDDVDYFESIGINLTPCTVVYKNNEELWRKQGAFFTLQLDELRKYI